MTPFEAQPARPVRHGPCPGCGGPRSPQAIRCRTCVRPVRRLHARLARWGTATRAERFWALVDKGPNEGGCWLWLGHLTPAGYGQYSFGDRATTGAHRLAYELTTAIIPAGLHLDHLCRIRQCVNPAHLEPVTPAENNRRSARVYAASPPTYCRSGHPYGSPYRPGKHRHCQTCVRTRHTIYMRSYRRRAAGSHAV